MSNANTVQARLTPSKPKPTEVDFRFQDYRSPSQLSDDSDTASPVPPPVCTLFCYPFRKLTIQTPPSVAAQNQEIGDYQTQAKFSTFSLNKSMEPPQEHTPNRRKSKMRFSFLMTADESPNCAKSARRKARPSLAIIDDFPAPAPVSARAIPSSPLKQSTPAAYDNGIQSTPTESRIPRPSSSFAVSKEPSPTTTSHRSRESSRLSCSEFFDAREEPSIIEQLDPIFEENELRDLRKPIQSRPQRVEQTQAPRESFIRQELAKIEAEIVEEDDDVEDDETIRDVSEYEEEESMHYEENDDLEPAKEGDLVILDTISIGRSRNRRKCTQATIIDIQRLKRKAISLVRYEESEDVYAELTERLQRMYRREEKLAAQEGRAEALLRKLARWLHDWLEKIEEGRVITGENSRFLRHELEWAEWIEEATRKGVLHIKVKGCLCEREWRM